jgi:hypothetical protein
VRVSEVERAEASNECNKIKEERKEEESMMMRAKRREEERRGELHLVTDAARGVHVALESLSYPLDGIRVTRVLGPKCKAVLLAARAHLR